MELEIRKLQSIEQMFVITELMSKRYLCEHISLMQTLNSNKIYGNSLKEV